MKKTKNNNQELKEKYNFNELLSEWEKIETKAITSRYKDTFFFKIKNKRSMRKNGKSLFEKYIDDGPIYSYHFFRKTWVFILVVLAILIPIVITISLAEFSPNNSDLNNLFKNKTNILCATIINLSIIICLLCFPIGLFIFIKNKKNKRLRQVNYKKIQYMIDFTFKVLKNNGLKIDISRIKTQLILLSSRTKEFKSALLEEKEQILKQLNTIYKYEEGNFLNKKLQLIKVKETMLESNKVKNKQNWIWYRELLTCIYEELYLINKLTWLSRNIKIEKIRTDKINNKLLELEKTIKKIVNNIDAFLSIDSFEIEEEIISVTSMIKKVKEKLVLSTSAYNEQFIKKIKRGW